MHSTLKDYNELNMKKAAVGLKVMTDNVAFDSSMDIVSQRYNAGMVYAVGFISNIHLVVQ